MDEFAPFDGESDVSSLETSCDDASHSFSNKEASDEENSEEENVETCSNAASCEHCGASVCLNKLLDDEEGDENEKAKLLHVPGPSCVEYTTCGECGLVICADCFYIYHVICIIDQILPHYQEEKEYNECASCHLELHTSCIQDCEYCSKAFCRTCFHLDLGHEFLCSQNNPASIMERQKLGST